MANPKFSYSSERSDYVTPQRYLDAARDVMDGIELDPATSVDINDLYIKADRIFTKETNGLVQPWVADTVWLNPPYGYLELDGKQKVSVPVWVNKLLDEFTDGRVEKAMLLVNSSTDASWFTNLWNFPICFTDHRIQFELLGRQKKKQPTKGNAIVYFCRTPKDCLRFFARFEYLIGHVVLPSWFWLSDSVEGYRPKPII